MGFVAFKMGRLPDLGGPPAVSNSKHPKSRPVFVDVIWRPIVIPLVAILGGSDVNRDFWRRATEEIGGNLFFVPSRKIILPPLSVNQRDNRLDVGIKLYNAISRHSPLPTHYGSQVKR
jgi:hypothetical protein